MVKVPRIFESGFLAYPTDPDDPNNDLPHSAELQTITAQLNAGTLSYEGWAFRKQVIQLANRLFGPLDEWITLQLTNDRLTPAHYGLIEDIVSFISTGRPELELSVRATMIGYASRDAQTVDGTAQLADKRESLATPLPVDGKRALAVLISHPGGFDYLLSILKYIFGTKK